MRERLALYSRNTLKLGLFGANCSSGRAVTKAGSSADGWQSSRNWKPVFGVGNAESGHQAIHRLSGYSLLNRVWSAIAMFSDKGPWRRGF